MAKAVARPGPCQSSRPDPWGDRNGKDGNAADRGLGCLRAGLLGDGTGALAGHAPSAVWEVLARESASGALWFHISQTLWRVAAAFTLAMGIGCALEIALGLMPRLGRWADPSVTVFLNLPAQAVIVLCCLWSGLNEMAAITAVAAHKTAMVTMTIREGVRTLDRGVTDLARIDRFSPWKRLAHVIWSQLGPSWRRPPGTGWR